MGKVKALLPVPGNLVLLSLVGAYFFPGVRLLLVGALADEQHLDDDIARGDCGVDCAL